MVRGRDLSTVLDQIQAEVAMKKDYIAPARGMEMSVQMVKDAPKFVLALNDDLAFGIGNIAHGQMAQFLDIPTSYYERMRENAPNLLASNVNRWLETSTAQRMVRTLGPTARAVLSDRFRPLDNLDLAETVLPALMNAGVEVGSVEITDARLYIQALYPRIQREVTPGDVVQSGVVISNSEVGLGSLRVEAMVYRLVCRNGAIMATGLRRAHLGRRTGNGDDVPQEWLRDETRNAEDRAIFLKAHDVVAGILDETRFERVVATLRDAAAREISGDPVKVVEVTAKRFGLTEGERVQALKNLIGERSLTQYGLSNAITAIANETAEYDRAIDLERWGGEVAEMDGAVWREIGAAA